MRDGDKDRYHGKGTQQAVENIQSRIAPELVGLDVTDQRLIDRTMLELDGTPNKEELGANAILAVSMAAAHAGAAAVGLPLYRYLGGTNSFLLPVPMMNVINGGQHGDNDVDLQEFMIVPHGFDSFSRALRAGCEIYQSLKRVVKDHGFVSNVGDEGGFAPALKSDEQALALIQEAIELSGYQLGTEISFALDCAASEFYIDGKYHLQSQNRKMDAMEMIEFYQELAAKYPIFSIEDPLSEDDWKGWSNMTAQAGAKLQIVGDDLLVTNVERLQKAIEQKSCNSILIKLNQIGTISETLDTISLAHQHGFSAVISHRSGETEDTTIAHLAVGTGAGQIKTGAPCRTDRVAKYNELLRIEEYLGDSAIYGGTSVIEHA
jgi:enolase